MSKKKRLFCIDLVICTVEQVLNVSVKIVKCSSVTGNC